jgi:hypothetical protein
MAVGILASVSAALTWAWADWPLWSLALAHAGAAVILFGALAPVRQKAGAFQSAVLFLSAAPIVAAGGLSAFATLVRSLNDAFDSAAPALVATPEWATMVIVLSLGGMMFAFEALTRRDRSYGFAASGVLLLALELALAMLQIENVQVYTAPIALALIGAGLTFRRSDPLFEAHMFAHEALFVLGAGLLTIPAAAESFAPGGGAWGLVVIAQGLALLALGLVMVQRWLAVSGVVTLIGVAGRFVFDSTSSGHVPYWLMLGVAGLLLLGVGVLMLLERDWWDRSRAHMVRWWLEGEAEPPVVSH